MAMTQDTSGRWLRPLILSCPFSRHPSNSAIQRHIHFRVIEYANMSDVWRHPPRPLFHVRCPLNAELTFIPIRELESPSLNPHSSGLIDGSGSHQMVFRPIDLLPSNTESQTEFVYLLIP